YKRLQIIARRAVFIVNLFERQRLRTEGFQDFVVLLDLELELLLKALRMNQVDHPQAGARRLVAVGRADAALGGADFVFALENFALLVQLAVIREDDVRRFTEKQIPVHLDLQLPQAFDFLDQIHRVHHDAVADDALLALAQDAGGNEMQDEFSAAEKNGVTRIVAALRADDDV